MGNAKDVSLIIVGAGYAGLATAIECTRKGCKVKVFESVKKLTNQGDVIQIAPNATRLMERWGDVIPNVLKTAASPESLLMQDKTGKLILEQPLPAEYEGHPMLYVNRGLTQKHMYDYAVSIGVEFHFNTRITKYFEEANSAGIYVGDVKYEADAVIATDGIHSKAQPIVTGLCDKPQSSGFAVYRSWFSLDALKNDPLTKDIAESKTDLFLVWIGEDTHAIITTNTKLNSIVCFTTHKDNYSVEESWSFPGTIPDMLKAVDGWDEKLSAVIKKIPPEILIDWKLLWRDPVKEWVSKSGRIVLAGDAAHPHLATSGQGGAQAIEDGATLAAVIDRAGKENIPLAFRAFTQLRYERTNLTQRMGWETRHRWHQTDWEMVKAHPEVLKMPQPAWLFSIDAEKYAYDNYDAVVQHLENSTPFNSTNVPEGYIHQEWSVETMMALEREQSKDENFVVKG